MKHLKLVWALLLMMATPALFTACGEQNNEKNDATVEVLRISNVTYDSAVAVANVVGDKVTACGVCYAKTTKPTINDSNIPAKGQGEFEVTLESLDAGTTYYVRAYAVSGSNTIYSEEKIFSTLELGQPLLKVNDATEVSTSSAVLSGALENLGGNTATERGLAWMKVGDNPESDFAGFFSTGNLPEGAGKWSDTQSVTGALTTTAENLEDDTTYGFVAYVICKSTVFHSDIKTFKTEAYGLPVATLVEITDVTANSMKVKGNVTTDNPLDITERGVLYGITSSVESATKVAATTAGTGEFTVTLDQLEGGVNYYIWVYAENKSGQAISDFVTKETTSNKPVVAATVVNEVLSHTINVIPSIGSLGQANAPLTEIGIVYSSTNKNPTIGGSDVTQVVLAKDPLSISKEGNDVNGLKAETTYYVAAYATNQYGTSYGDVETIKTLYDIWENYVGLFENAGVDPYIGGGQANPYNFADGLATTPLTKTPSLEYCSQDYLDMINTLDQGLQTLSTRRFGRLRWYVGAENEDGSGLYIHLEIFYVNTNGATFGAAQRFRLQKNEDGSLCAYGESSQNESIPQGNYNNIHRESASVPGYLAAVDKFYNFFKEPFYMEHIRADKLYVPGTFAVYRFVKKGEPETYFSFTGVRMTGMKPTPF